MAQSNSRSIDIDFPGPEGKNEDLVCIEYPGLVRNVDAALSTLGGDRHLQESLHKPFEVRFRPTDPNCHPVHGKKRSCTGFLLKCKRKRNHEEDTGCHFKAEVLAVVNSVVEFSEMCDFQALHPGLHKSPKCKTIPRDAYEITRLLNGSDITSSSPLFLPPLLFNKFSTPMKLNLYEHTAASGEPANKKTLCGSQAMSFDLQKAVPERPLGTAEKIPSDHPHMATLIKLFEEKPIWSRSALEARCDVPQIKKYLSSIAYHFTAGPWRLLWVKLGYDPRKKVESKIHQSIDFRVPRDLDSGIPSRTSKSFQYGRRTSASLNEPSSSKSQENAETASLGVVFGPGHLPYQRFSIYQLCDLQDDTLQAIVHSNDGKEPSECNPVTGWCEPQAYDKLRKRMIEIFKLTLEKQQCA